MSLLRYAIYDKDKGLYLKKAKKSIKSSCELVSSIVYEHVVEAEAHRDIICPSGEVVKAVYIPAETVDFCDSPGFYDAYTLVNTQLGALNPLANICEDIVCFNYCFLYQENLKPEYHTRCFKTEDEVRAFQSKRKKELDSVSDFEYKRRFKSRCSNDFMEMSKKQFDPENLLIVGLTLKRA